MTGSNRGSENKRAVERAKRVLKPGDRLLVGTCGNHRGSTVTMVGWSTSFPDFIASKSLHDDELHPINVRKVNGIPVDFSDAGDAANSATGRALELLRVHLRRAGVDPAFWAEKAAVEAMIAFAMDDPGSRYNEAVAVVCAAERASTALVQRVLYVAYEEAKRYIERMERAGIVSLPNSDGARRFLCNPNAPA